MWNAIWRSSSRPPYKSILISRGDCCVGSAVWHRLVNAASRDCWTEAWTITCVPSSLLSRYSRPRFDRSYVIVNILLDTESPIVSRRLPEHFRRLTISDSSTGGCVLATFILTHPGNRPG